MNNKNLPTEILRFFAFDMDDLVNKSPAKTIEDFLTSHNNYEELDLVLFTKIMSKLKSEGLILTLGTEIGDKSPIPNEKLIAPNFNESVAKYGTYDFLINGFRDIANTFKSSVVPIVITKTDGTKDIGTGFLVGNKYSIITAKHVVKDAEIISIIAPDDKISKVQKVVYSSNNDVDIALILVCDASFTNSKPFNAVDGEILEEVLTIGYPPIPGFDAF